MTKTKIYSLIFSTIAVVTATGWFFNHYQIKTQAPVEFHKPLWIVPRVLAVYTTTVVQADQLPLNENEKYLCIKFGGQCRTALQIQHLENGNEACDRMNVNDNHTVDFGFMQINTVHLNKGVKVADLIDCKKNIDIAYTLYSQAEKAHPGHGWDIWSTYKLIK